MRLGPLFDIIALIFFAVFARAAHPPFTFLGMLDAFWPWAVGALIGWVIVSFVHPRNLYSEGAIVWPSAIILGILFWRLANGRFPHYSMIIVTIIVSLLLMFGWRVVVMRRNAKAARTARN